MSDVLPSVDELRARYEYDSELGLLRYRSKSVRSKMGFALGRLNNRGYLRTTMGVNGKQFHAYVHRLIWAICKGEHPPENKLVDHINRIRTDNRIENLRLVDAHGNCANSPVTKKPSYLPCNVSLVVRKEAVRYQAGKTYKQKRYYLGIFKTPEEAAAAVDNWRPA